MKKFLSSLLSLLSVFVLLLPLFAACNKTESPTDNPSPTNTDATAIKDTDNHTSENKETNKETDPPKSNEPDPFKDGKLSIDNNDISNYVIVIPATPKQEDTRFANDLSAWVKKITGYEITIVNDSAAPTANEIIVGNTSRTESTEISGDFNATTHYRAVLKDGKIAIKFNKGTGGFSAINAMQRAFANNDCNITEGFTNTSLELEEIKGFVKGAIRSEITDDGLHLYKSTEAQVAAWQQLTATDKYNDWTRENAHSAIGIRLDFDTDSSYVSLKLSKATSNMVLLLNNELVKSNWSGGIWTVPKNELGKTNRITILMSDVRDTHLWGIQELEIDGGCKITPHKSDLNMLFFGDSITEQFFSGQHSARHYTFYTYTYFNAEAVVQGNGSSQIWSEMIDPDMAELYQPDVIVIALGTNDYSENKTADVDWFENRMDSFLDKLKEVYPEVPIIGITPLRRLLSMNSSNTESNYDKTCVETACAGYARSYESHGAKVIRGDELLKKPEHYQDTVHPNDEGHLLVGENLCIAIEQDIKQIIKNKNQ